MFQIASEIDRKNMLWQSMRKKLKREFNREKAAYDEWLEADGQSSEDGTKLGDYDGNDGSGSIENGDENIEIGGAHASGVNASGSVKRPGPGLSNYDDNVKFSHVPFQNSKPGYSRGLGMGAQNRGNAQGAKSTGPSSTRKFMKPPLEIDYAEVERIHFGHATKELDKLQVLKLEVYSLADKAIQSLRYASLNISQRVRVIF